MSASNGKPTERYVVMSPVGVFVSHAKPTQADAITAARFSQDKSWHRMLREGYELVRIQGAEEPYISMHVSLPESVHEYLTAQAARAGRTVEDFVSLHCHQWIISEMEAIGE